MPSTPEITGRIPPSPTRHIPPFYILWASTPHALYCTEYRQTKCTSDQSGWHCEEAQNIHTLTHTAYLHSHWDKFFAHVWTFWELWILNVHWLWAFLCDNMECSVLMLHVLLKSVCMCVNTGRVFVCACFRKSPTLYGSTVVASKGAVLGGLRIEKH